jgi:hypothetical protein
MNDREAALLTRYAGRGDVRGADAVWADARASALRDYIGEPGDARRPRRGGVLLVAVAVVVLGVLAVVSLGATRRTTEVPASVDSLPSASTLSVPTDEEMQEARRRAAELGERGWGVFAIERTITPGDAPPPIGYVKVGPGPSYVSIDEQDAKGMPRKRVYDQPDGRQLGYLYMNLGFVHKAQGDDPAFDAAPLYRATGACAPIDGDCAHEQMERALAEARTARGTAPG